MVIGKKGKHMLEEKSHSNNCSESSDSGGMKRKNIILKATDKHLCINPKQMKKNPIYTAVKGIAASGKTSVIQRLVEITKGIHCIKEPIHLLTTFKQFNPLAKSYYEPKIKSAIAQKYLIKSSAS